MAFNTALFARMPQNKIGHSSFKRPFIHAGTMMHGDIVPIYCKLVSPGEVIKTHLYGNVRMSPIAPLYSAIKISFNAFFIPLRLVWDHTKEFFGENTSGTNPITGTYTIPMSEMNDPNHSFVKVHTVSHYLGKPLYKGSTIETGTHKQEASILKERAYWLTISEWYRHEQLQAPAIIYKSDNSNIASYLGDFKTVGSACAKCLKDFDYFTTATRFPQFGPDVSLPLGSIAPLTTSSFYEVGNIGMYNKALPNASRLVGSYNDQDTDYHVLSYAGSSTSEIASGTLNMTNLYADLRNATAATIDELYLAMAAQAWYHNANFGSRYFEMLQIHYSVTNPDLVLQRPEHIGEAKRFIQVQQVIATADSGASGSSKLGQPGANSSTQIDVNFPRHSFGEWGYYLILANTYHERYYTAGFLREDLYSDMFDFFFPEFSNIGDMSVLSKELYSASSLDPDVIFGFQEAWSEMRYSPNRLSGLFDPYVVSQNAITGYTAPMKGWVLSEKWSNQPTLSSQFITEDREAIKDVLIGGSNGPDYLFYFYFDEKTLSEVPVYSKPGLPGRGRGIL